MSQPKAKKPKVMQSFRAAYEQKWPGVIKRSSVSEEFARCCVCYKDIRITHGGANDIEKHLDSIKHKDLAKSKASNKTMNNFVKPKVHDSVTNAECLFVKFLVEHNIPLSAADHAAPLFKAMFPDSSIAGDFACARTKTTAISNHFGEEISRDLASTLKSTVFSLSTDGSNDKGSETLYPILIRFYSAQYEEVVSELLTLASCKTSSTGLNIFNLLDKELTERGISWDKCISFGCDNASVMVGLHKGVAAFLHKVNPAIQIQGCPCHLLHIAAKNGSKQLSVDVELALIDLYHYFDKSTKRQQEFILMLEETGTAVRKILKHGPTRWLSLERCVVRLLEQWDAFVEYFSSVEDTSGVRYKRIKAFFENPLSKAYCLFLAKSLPLFVSANTFLQKEEPLLHCMQQKILEILTTLAVRFIKAKKVGDLLNMDFRDKDLHKHREDVVIGSDTRSYLTSLNLSTSKETVFYNDVRRFYSEATAYIAKKLPVDSELLAHAGVLLPSQRLDFEFTSIRKFVEKMPSICEKDSIDLIEEEFLIFQQEELSEDISNCKRVDKAWAMISKIRKVDGELKYSNLSKVMLAIAVIPHSNAECERIFSMVKKCKTEFRASMSTRVLSNLIIQKMSMQSGKTVCHKVKLNASQLSAAKGACSKQLQENKE